MSEKFPSPPLLIHFRGGGSEKYEETTLDFLLRYVAAVLEMGR